MLKKYHPEQISTMPEQSTSTIITTDLYLAAFLHSTGCTLVKAQRNERSRLSFIFSGERVRDLREAYRVGPVKLDMRSFRESLVFIRRLMDAQLEQRSQTHEPKLQTHLQP